MKFVLLFIGLAVSTSVSGSADPAGASATSPETVSNRADAAAAPSVRGGPAPLTSTRLNEVLPKFSPPSPALGSTDSVEPRSSETERPRNDIVRLPPYDVRQRGLPIFRERELRTPAGRVDGALKRHPGLKFGSLAFLNVRPGLKMLAETDALERRREMNELWMFSAAVERTSPREPGTENRTLQENAAE